MHKIVEAHLKSFVQSHAYTHLDESTQFERFVNFSLLTASYSSQYDLDDVSTGDGDDGIDGVAIIIDEEVINSKEDVQNVFGASKRNHDVEILFTQAKSGENFDLGEVLKFNSAVLRFLSADQYVVNDETQQNAWECYSEVLRHVPKIRNGKPTLVMRYVTTGVYKEPQAIETAKRDFLHNIEELGYFNHVDYRYLGRNEIVDLWISTYSGVTASLEMFSHAPLPKISGIEEAYLAVVKAKELVKCLLETEDGSLRTHVFEENVRSFLGDSNPVNESIGRTVSDGTIKSRFPVLNNGVTVVSPDVRVQGNVLHLENFQIVNGCQTSNVLFNHKEELTDDVMVTLKVVETTNEDVFSDLVRATNSQTKVEETQFLSLRPIVKKIEQYFNSFEEGDGRLYFERRERQYVGRDIPAIRTFSLHNLTKCVAAMFCERPDLAYRYPKSMYETLSEKIFDDDNREIVFYTACLVLYRLHLLIASSEIPQNMKRNKWHLIMLVRCLISGIKMPALRDRKIEPYCQKIIDTLIHKTDQGTAFVKKAVTIFQSIGEISDDRLKRQAVISEMKDKIK
jgi:hypothetical protein